MEGTTPPDTPPSSPLEQDPSEIYDAFQQDVEMHGVTMQDGTMENGTIQDGNDSEAQNVDEQGSQQDLNRDAMDTESDSNGRYLSISGTRTELRVDSSQTGSSMEVNEQSVTLSISVPSETTHSDNESETQQSTDVNNTERYFGPAVPKNYRIPDDFEPSSPHSVSRPTSPRTPPSPSSNVSMSAVSNTEPTRGSFGGGFDLSGPLELTPRAHGSSSDDISAATYRRELPRGDLGISDWKFDNRTDRNSRNRPGSPPPSPSSTSRHSVGLPEPPMSPPSSPTAEMSQVSESGFANPSETVRESERMEIPGLGARTDEDQYSNAVVWGTDVSVVDSMRLFRQFLNEFYIDEDRSVPYYSRVLEQMHATQIYVMNVDCQHLIQYHPTQKLYDQLVHFPQVLIKIFDMVVREEFEKQHGAPEVDLRVQVRTFNLRTVHPLRDLDPADIDQLVSLRGMIIRSSSIIPDLKQAFFRCGVCQSTKEVVIDRGHIEEPTICVQCNGKGCMVMVHNRCSFTDKQMIKMQETPDAIPEGETPHTVTLFAFDDLVDRVRPGDKIEVTGIFRALPFRPSPKQRVVRSVFKTYLDVIHYRTLDGAAAGTNAARNVTNVDSNGLAIQDSNNVQELQRKKEQEFHALAQDPEIYEKLSSSLAPSIWELDDVKRGILCQLFGGNDKTDVGAASGRFRAGINILLCGDPGTSKSQLLSYVHKLAPRSIYTSGKGSSAVGLTASVVKDQESGDLVLESGALVLSDQGVCCIDEFDKMSENTRSVLHEAMEQQTVSIAKAGIICTLNARTSILASANPIESRYNPTKSVVENINVVPTLLSRFDLIYLVLDNPNAESDRKLARHIVSLYFESCPVPPAPIPMEFLSEYIAYARKNIFPKLTPEASQDLIQAYLEMRKLGASRGSITATPRQLESVIRLSEAHAKIRFSETVERRDVAEATRLMNVATQRAALDPSTGTIDMDMITTGHSAKDRQAMNDMTATMTNVLKERFSGGKTVSLNDLRSTLEEELKQDVKKNDFMAVVRALQEENVIQVLHSTVRVLT